MTAAVTKSNLDGMHAGPMPSLAPQESGPARFAERLNALAPANFRRGAETEQVSAFLGRKLGTFVEVGAFDPVELSQTFHLEMAGWNGVLVEPLPEYAERLRRHRRAMVFEVAAGSPEDEGKQQPLLQAGALSTLRREIKQLGAHSAQPRMVKIRTLDSILAEAGAQSVDFISIDVEGMELSVLRGFSIERYRPRLILIEDDLHNLHTHRYMCAAGYKIVRRTELNNWYVPRQTAFPISLFGHLQLLRTLYLSPWLRRTKYAWRKWRQRD